MNCNFFISFVYIFTFFILKCESKKELKCFVSGECTFSQHLELFTSKDEFECLGSCKTNSNCTWFTYYPASSSCQLFSNCKNVDDAFCTDCQSGQKECQVPEPVCWVQGIYLKKITYQYFY